MGAGCQEVIYARLATAVNHFNQITGAPMGEIPVLKDLKNKDHCVDGEGCCPAKQAAVLSILYPYKSRIIIFDNLLHLYNKKLPGSSISQYLFSGSLLFRTGR